MRNVTYKRPKYGNKKIENSYGKFDSNAEWERFLFLSGKVSEGEIKDLRRQVKYVLIPKQEGERIIQLKTKKKIEKYPIESECSYYADFVYERKVGDEWITIVEDVKGIGVKTNKGRFSTQTPEFRIKKKLMLFVHHIQLSIIGSASEW